MVLDLPRERDKSGVQVDKLPSTACIVARYVLLQEELEFPGVDGLVVPLSGNQWQFEERCFVIFVVYFSCYN